MRIERLQIQNIRAIEELSVEFSPHFNVIAGENGSGKTTILEILARVLSRWTSKPKAVIMRKDHRCSLREGHEGVPYVKEHGPHHVEVLGEGPDGGHGQSLLHGMTNRRDQWLRTVQDRDEDPVQLPLLALFSPYRAPPERKPGPSEVHTPRVRLAGYDGAFDLWANSKSVEIWLKTFEQASYQEGKRFPALEAARGAIASCLLDCVDVRYYPRTNQVMIKRTDGRLEPFELLSDGYRTIATLVGELALRAVTLNPMGDLGAPEKIKGVVLIDELDLHLHPIWQRGIAAQLHKAFPKVQFITTTHSPFIIQSMHRDQVINLDRSTRMEYWREGIEDIATEVMGVEPGRDVPRSKLYRDLQQAAEEYYALLEQYDEAHPEVSALRARLDKLEELFTDDPGMATFLRANRIAKLRRSKMEETRGRLEGSSTNEGHNRPNTHAGAA